MATTETGGLTRIEATFEDVVAKFVLTYDSEGYRYAVTELSDLPGRDCSVSPGTAPTWRELVTLLEGFEEFEDVYPGGSGHGRTELKLWAGGAEPAKTIVIVNAAELPPGLAAAFTLLAQLNRDLQAC